MKLIADRAERLDVFLARSMPGVSRSRLAKSAAAGEVLVGGAAAKPGTRLEPGVEIEFEAPVAPAPHAIEPTAMALEVLFEDADLLVVNKPRGLVTHPAASHVGPTLVSALLARSSPTGGPAYRPGIVHRLDKETTGLMVVAKTEAAHAALAAQIEAKTAARTYLALVAGTPSLDRFDVDAPLGRDAADRTRMAISARGKPALTHVRKLRQTARGALLVVRLESGRTHQIRVHLAGVGLPVLGDRRYARGPVAEGPLQLHAARLAFDHPRTGERLAFVAAPPPDFDAEGPVDPRELAPTDP